MHTINRCLLFALMGTASFDALATAAVHADVVDALKAELPMPPGDAASTNTAWRIHAGSTLRKSIETWASAARYQVVWHARHGFNIEANATFQGDFLTATKSLFDGYGASESPLYVDVYPDQRLLVVTSTSAAVLP
jgi:hypothetical protein